jgi:hypothetical protein
MDERWETVKRNASALQSIKEWLVKALWVRHECTGKHLRLVRSQMLKSVDEYSISTPEYWIVLSALLGKMRQCSFISLRIVLHYLHIPPQVHRSQDSSVGMPTDCGLDGRGNRFVSTPQHPDWLWTHPASCPVCTGGSFLRGKGNGKWS